MMWGIVDPVLMHGLPRVGAWAALRRLAPVLQACFGRLTFTCTQNRVVIPYTIPSVLLCTDDRDVSVAVYKTVGVATDVTTRPHRRECAVWAWTTLVYSWEFVGCASSLGSLIFLRVSLVVVGAL